MRKRDSGLPIHAAAPAGAEVRAQIAALESVLRGRGVRSLALFGSVARRDAGPASDVDVLIDVNPDAGFSLVDLVEIKTLLESRLRRQVDIVTPGGLDPRFRKRVLEDAEPVFG